MILADRVAAGQLLANQLIKYANAADTLVLALPRGGVPVAFEMAMALNLPLDVLIVRKLGAPGQPELALGAIAPGGVCLLNRDIVRDRQLFSAAIHQITVREQRELERRERLYRGDRPPANLAAQRIILVDDGLATGATMRAAILAVQQQQPSQIIVAVPVGPASTCQSLGTQVDRVVCLQTPDPFRSVGLWYERFPQVSDEEVCALLQQAEDGRLTAIAP